MFAKLDAVNKNFSSKKNNLDFQMANFYSIQVLQALSFCKINYEGVNFLDNLFEGAEIELSLAYRASEHGWMARDFHSRCDLIGATISLF